MVLIIKHVSIEGPGMVGDFFQRHKWKMRNIELEEGDKLPHDFRDIEAIVVLGGPMSVYEEIEYPFLKEEDSFLKEALNLEIPVLGICLGAQALAKAAGASVRKADSKEIGWYEVDVTEEGRRDPLFQGLGRSLKVFQWHEDEFDVPHNGLLLAESCGHRNQAFKVGKCAYGLQFHIEVTPAMVESWVRMYLDSGKEEGRIDTRKLLNDTHRKRGRFTRQANRFLINFSKLIAKNRGILG